MAKGFLLHASVEHGGTLVLAGAAVADRNIDLHFVFYTKMILNMEEKACINVPVHVIC